MPEVSSIDTLRALSVVKGVWPIAGDGDLPSDHPEQRPLADRGQARSGLPHPVRR